jgi:hypothetical protein
VSGGTIGENAHRRYRVRSGHTPRGIPVPRTSQLLTNPILAAPAGQPADRRISAGFIVEAATGAPDSHASRLLKRRTTRTRGPACLTIIQSYQRHGVLLRRPMRMVARGASNQPNSPFSAPRAQDSGAISSNAWLYGPRVNTH